MTTRTQKPNRFLRPKREKKTAYEKVKGNLRSLVFWGGAVAVAGYTLSYLAKHPDALMQGTEANAQMLAGLQATNE